MTLPKSVTKVTEDGVTFTSSVDRAQYLLVELQRRALRDVAMFIRKRMIEKLKKLRGMKKHRRLSSSTQWWVRNRETDLIIGFKHNTWYGVLQELGTKNQPKRDILRSTVFDNIDQIMIIQGQYLSAIEEENRALGLIKEVEYLSGEDEE